jgi:hypothetical protein
LSTILEYFEALERLKKNEPERVPPNTKISKDSVALEAGRRKGSIKKGRKVFAKLIEEIEKSTLVKQASKRIAEKYKVQAADYRNRYEQALGREAMLLKNVYELEAKIAKLTSTNVYPIQSGR